MFTLDFPIICERKQWFHWRWNNGTLIVRTNHVQQHLVFSVTVTLLILGRLLLCCTGRRRWNTETKQDLNTRNNKKHTKT